MNYIEAKKFVDDMESCYELSQIGQTELSMALGVLAYSDDRNYFKKAVENVSHFYKTEGRTDLFGFIAEMCIISDKFSNTPCAVDMLCELYGSDMV